ncbi:MAG: adenylate cyclase, partial [Rhodospirillaceae bacterium]|nr:adenylate cyclase [Rhodospirillaceae bacterium]
MSAPVRKLAAILAVDVVGYSRLMGEDQARTLDALRQLRRELFEPVVEEFRGNVVKRMGDGWIVEFASVSDAVDCAIRFQEGLAGHDIIRLRAGIHIGEVVFEDEDVFGEGVNVAARLEELAEPGEVLISDTVQNSLDKRSAQDFSGGDSHQLNNIERSVDVWRWSSAGAQQATLTESEAPVLTDKPSIAVLPFDNMSGDPEQEYFADGITEDIITELSRFREFLVIARNSTFVYKGEAKDLSTVARELNARYIVEGSVRKAGNRVRVTAQLIEGATNTHLWADRFDGVLADIFALQDEITVAIVSA